MRTFRLFNIMKLPVLMCVFALAVLTFSCEKEVKFKGNGKDPVLVLNGVVENDSTFRVNLERSVFFLDNNAFGADKYIESGATITVTNVSSGQIYISTTPTTLGTYDFPFTVTPNTQYQIEVKHPDYPTISSNVTTASKVTLLSVDTVSFYEQYGSKKLSASLKWNDPSEENYYIIRVESTDSISGSGSNYPDSFWMTSSDVSVDNSTTSNDIDGTVYLSDYLLVSDKLFNGTQKQLKIEISNSYSSENVSMRYKLITTNKETYQYFASLKKQQKMDFLSEPVQIFSNIKGGFGIFGTLSYSEIVK